MSSDKKIFENKAQLSNAGRVIDLRKNSEIKNSDSVFCKQPSLSQSSVLPKKIFSFWRKKKHAPNFLRAYLFGEKKEEFIEEELLNEYLSDEEEEKKKDYLSFFLAKIEQAAHFRCLPWFILKFSWRIFWNFKKKELINSIKFGSKPKKKAAFVIKSQKTSSNLEVENSWKDFLSAIFLWPKSIISFIFGRTTEECLYQKVILDDAARYKFRPWRHVLSFSLMIFAVLLPIKIIAHDGFFDFNSFKEKVLNISQKAFGNLSSAANSVSAMDMDGAKGDFYSAKENFSQAKNELDKVNYLLFELGKIIPNRKIRLASYSKEFIAIGEAASSLGENLAAAANVFSSSAGKTPSEMINDFLFYEATALEESAKINSILSGINEKILPDDYLDFFKKLKASAVDLEMILSSAADIAKKADIFLGADSDKRYLFIFQNNSEMRASGGFVGSYALLDFSRGRVKNIEVPGGGSYDTERDLKEFVVSPEPLWLVDPLWHFWDANWWPDWKNSAQKLSWFYEKSGGPTVDGVIAFTPTVLERVLEVIGPIDMTEDYGLVMTADNLWVNLRDIIEKEKAEDQSVPQKVSEKKPKRVIGDLFGKIMEEAPKRLGKESLPNLLSALSSSLDDKQILFYFSDNNLQAEAEKRNWAGRLKETNKDYLYVVNTNIAGGKSDGKIEEKITHQAEIQPDGSIVDTITIKKIHNGVVDEPYFGVRNVNWLRVYVPLGSQLLEASGFRGPDPIYFDYPEENWSSDIDVAAEEGANSIIDSENLNTKIYEESGKTVFANWIMIDPGQEIDIHLKYKLPFKLEKKIVKEESKNFFDRLWEKFNKTETENKELYVYSLMVQKQPGMRFSAINASLSTPEPFKSIWGYPANLNIGGGFSVSEDLNIDKYWAVLLEKNNYSYGQ